jgi:hypothetical protein
MILGGVLAALTGVGPADAQGDPQPKSLGGQCAKEVGAQYRAFENRWYFVGRGQELNFFQCLDSRLAAQRSGASPSATTPRRVAARPTPKPAFAEERHARATLNGVDSRIAAMNFVNMDCSSGPLPEVRIVTAPGSGELRLEPIKYAVSRDKKNSRFHCNGKTVDAVGVFYKSKENFVGLDKLVLDVDFKAGTVKRFVYMIDIR